MIPSYYTAYRTLQLPVGAGLAEIKDAYRRLAMRHHPDRGGDVAEFQKITAAYTQLVEFVSNSRIGAAPTRTAVTVTLEQIASGEPVILAVPVENSTRFIEFAIDPSWSSGQQVTIKDPNALDSTVTVTYNIAKHAVYKKVGLDLFCQIEVPVWDIIVGGTVEVTDLLGRKFGIAFRPSTTLTPGPTLTVAGRGFTSKCGAAGDLCVTLCPVLPKTISAALKEAILAEQSLHKGLR